MKIALIGIGLGLGLVCGVGGTAHADEPEEIDFDTDPHPAVLVKDVVEAHAAIPLVAVPGGDTITFASAGFGWGIASDLEIGGDLLVQLANGNEKFATTAHAAYTVYREGKLEIAAAAGLGLAVVAVPDGLGDGKTVGETDVALLAGAWARYHVSPELAVFTGQPALPIAGTTGGLPPFTYQLEIGVDNSRPTSFTLPIGASYQVGKRLYAFAALELANLFLVNTPRGEGTLQLLFADFIPVGVGALVSPTDNVDVGVELGDDLEDASGRFVFQAFARLFVR